MQCTATRYRAVTRSPEQAEANLISQLACDRQMVHQVIFQLLALSSKRPLWPLLRIRDKCTRIQGSVPSGVPRDWAYGSKSDLGSRECLVTMWSDIFFYYYYSKLRLSAREQLHKTMTNSPTQINVSPVFTAYLTLSNGTVRDICRLIGRWCWSSKPIAAHPVAILQK